MTRRQLVTSVVVFVLCAVLVRSTASADDAFNSTLVRTAIVVSDVDVSKQFYSRAFGFRVGFDGDITRPSVRHMLGLSDLQTAHFTVLHGSERLDGEPVAKSMIGLLYVAGPELEAIERPASHSLAIGEAMLAIMTDDIAAVFQRVRELDATILMEPMPSPDGSESELVLRDPDGLRIHVVERHDAPRP